MSENVTNPEIIEALEERIHNMLIVGERMPRKSTTGFGIRNSDRDLMVAALIEIQRLNKWTNDFSDAQLKERLLAEKRIKEITLDRNGHLQRAERALIERDDARKEQVELIMSENKVRYFLISEGYRSCDLAACNCGLWHKRQESV